MESMDQNLADPDESNETEQTFLQEDGSTNLQALVLHNKAAIMAALKSNGVTNATSEYSGSGDEGSTGSVTVHPENTAALEYNVTVKMIGSTFDSSAEKWITKASDSNLTLEQALRDVTDQLIEMNGHAGYEDGDGGGGSVTFDVENDTVEHDHYDCVVENVHSVHEL